MTTDDINALTADQLRAENERLRLDSKRAWDMFSSIRSQLEAAQAAAATACEAVARNHKWHYEYDEHDGYPGSELESINAAALAGSMLPEHLCTALARHVKESGAAAFQKEFMHDGLSCTVWFEFTELAAGQSILRRLPCGKAVIEWAQPSWIRTPTGRNQPCPCGSGKKYNRCCRKGAKT